MPNLALKDTVELEKFPAVSSCRMITFDSAIVMNLSSNIHFLVVKGEKPYVNMTVTLTPKIYVVRPDYWEYDVIGCVGGILIPSLAPYVAVADVSFMRGKKGVEIVGANKRLKINIAGGFDEELIKA